MSPERCRQKDETLKRRYQETIDMDFNAGWVRKSFQIKVNETRCKLQWYLPHNLVIKPPKSEKVTRICNAAAKYPGAALNYYPG